nr:MAG TPA: hypothetical protein [Caudoviricetes sp.]
MVHPPKKLIFLLYHIHLWNASTRQDSTKM